MPDEKRRGPAEGTAWDTYRDGPRPGVRPLVLGDKFSTPEDAWVRLDPGTMLPLPDGPESVDDLRETLPDRFSIPAGGFEVLDGLSLLPIPQVPQGPEGLNLHGYPEGTPPDGDLSGSIASGPFDVLDGDYIDQGLHLRWWFEDDLCWVGYATVSRYRSFTVEGIAQEGDDLVAQKLGEGGATSSVIFRASALPYSDMRPNCYRCGPDEDGPLRPSTLPPTGPEGGEPMPDDWTP